MIRVYRYCDASPGACNGHRQIVHIAQVVGQAGVPVSQGHGQRLVGRGSRLIHRTRFVAVAQPLKHLSKLELLAIGRGSFTGAKRAAVDQQRARGQRRPAAFRPKLRHNGLRVRQRRVTDHHYTEQRAGFGGAVIAWSSC